MRRTKEEAMQTRETVLNAATQIIARQGFTGFTIDAVAHEAGLTKGGVLHHFPSKDDLINGLIDQVVMMFNNRLQEELQQETDEQPGRWLRAYIRTVFSVRHDENLLPALAAAVSAETQILDRIRKSFEGSQLAAVQDGTNPVLATIIRLAVDGMVFGRALNVDVLDPAESRRVYDELIRLTRQL